MCLAVPGKIIDLFDEGGTPMSRVDFEGTIIPVCMAFLPEAGIGDYVIVHAGFALSKIDENEARLSLALIERVTQPPDDTNEKPGSSQ